MNSPCAWKQRLLISGWLHGLLFNAQDELSTGLQSVMSRKVVISIGAAVQTSDSTTLPTSTLLLNRNIDDNFENGERGLVSYLAT
jgi:hypothetical protein